MKRFAAILCLVLGRWMCPARRLLPDPTGMAATAVTTATGRTTAVLCPAPYYRPYGYAAPDRAYYPGPAFGFGYGYGYPGGYYYGYPGYSYYGGYGGAFGPYVGGGYY